MEPQPWLQAPVPSLWPSGGRPPRGGSGESLVPTCPWDGRPTGLETRLHHQGAACRTPLTHQHLGHAVLLSDVAEVPGHVGLEPDMFPIRRRLLQDGIARSAYACCAPPTVPSPETNLLPPPQSTSRHPVFPTVGFKAWLERGHPRRSALTPQIHGLPLQPPAGPPTPREGLVPIDPSQLPATHTPVHSAPDLPLRLATRGPGSRSRGCQVLEARLGDGFPAEEAAAEASWAHSFLPLAWDLCLHLDLNPGSRQEGQRRPPRGPPALRRSPRRLDSPCSPAGFRAWPRAAPEPGAPGPAPRRSHHCPAGCSYTYASRALQVWGPADLRRRATWRRRDSGRTRAGIPGPAAVPEALRPPGLGCCPAGRGWLRRR